MVRTPWIEGGGFRFRDLNGNGRLDPYEDPRLSAEERTEDLLGRLGIEENVGLLVRPILGVSAARRGRRAGQANAVLSAAGRRRAGDVTQSQLGSVVVLTTSRLSAVVMGMSGTAPFASEKVSALPAGTENITNRA